jgi:hypothetical protein
VSITLVLCALEAPLPHVDKLTLIILADRAADDGTGCRPGLTYLSKRIGLAVSGVRAATIRLEDAGWLVRVAMGQRVHYLLDAPKLCALRSRVVSAPLTDPERSAQGSCSGSSHDTGRAHSVPRCGSGGGSQPILRASPPAESEADKIRRLEARREHIPALRDFRAAQAFESAESYRAAQDVACQCWEAMHRNPKPEERFGSQVTSAVDRLARRRTHG